MVAEAVADRLPRQQVLWAAVQFSVEAAAVQAGITMQPLLWLRGLLVALLGFTWLAAAARLELAALPQPTATQEQRGTPLKAVVAAAGAVQPFKPRPTAQRAATAGRMAEAAEAAGWAWTPALVEQVVLAVTARFTFFVGR